MVELFPDFRRDAVSVNGVRISFVAGGDGPPLLLLHGFPQTKAIWHKVAPRLAQRFTVVAANLRGYGDSAKPESSAGHATYSKREMARDQVELMRHLGFAKFAVIGHDRGGRVAHRMAMDHPASVDRAMLLDISPTLAMYEQTTQEFARAYWHWFFLIQPSPLPEMCLSANPEKFLLEFMGKRSAGMRPFHPDAWLEYVRAMSDEACVHAMCEDYRAAAAIDLEHDRADRDAGRKIVCSLRVLWGKHGVVEHCFRPLEDWQRVAVSVTGRALDCGHYIPEEAPEELTKEAEDFLRRE